jgi:hypothetical protein
MLTFYAFLLSLVPALFSGVLCAPTERSTVSGVDVPRNLTNAVRLGLLSPEFESRTGFENPRVLLPGWQGMSIFHISAVHGRHI